MPCPGGDEAPACFVFIMSSQHGAGGGSGGLWDSLDAWRYSASCPSGPGVEVLDGVKGRHL